MMILTFLALLSAPAHAETLPQILQQIADTTEPGNGNGHSVYQLRGAYHERQEAARLSREANKHAHEEGACRFEVRTDASGALKEMNNTFYAEATAKRLAGLERSGLLRGIVWSRWDGASGDAEYCSLSVMRVFAVDGTVLELNFDITD